MKRIVGTLMLICLYACTEYAQQSVTSSGPKNFNPPVNFNPRLSMQEKQHVLDGSCSVISSTDQMPKSLKDGFAVLTKEKDFDLANPGQKYQDTDVIIGHQLTLRRLVIAGSCDKIWFVHYERGGFTHSYAVLIFRTDSNGILQFIWGGAGFKRAKDVNDLRQAIVSSQFADDHDFYW